MIILSFLVSTGIDDVDHLIFLNIFSNRLTQNKINFKFYKYSIR